jgi:AraC family transcriptional regulator, melibiose operon regulatory protein
MLRWYADYRSGDAERVDVMTMEVNALFRRLSLTEFTFLRPPWRREADAPGVASAHVRHVIAMVRFVMENIERPLRNDTVTRVTGLHVNYALSLFSRTMLISLKQFIIRMRLLRARGLLLESNATVSSIAGASGFSSISQFYEHFSAAYGVTPLQMRERLTLRASGMR